MVLTTTALWGRYFFWRGWGVGILVHILQRRKVRLTKIL